MGIKSTELLDGCFAKAMDDEPMFVLLARDPFAPYLVRQWAGRRVDEIKAGSRPASDMVQVIEANQTASRMEAWRIEKDGAWRNQSLFADKPPACAEAGTIDVRPVNCRARLMATGQPYGRSKCAECGSLMRPNWKCPFTVNPDEI